MCFQIRGKIPGGGGRGSRRILHWDSFPNVFQFLFHFKEIETGNPRELIIGVIHAKKMARRNSNQRTPLKEKFLAPNQKIGKYSLYGLC